MKLCSICLSLSGFIYYLSFPDGSSGKEPAFTIVKTRVQSQGWEDPLEKEMSTHSSILAWRIPWTEDSGGLHSPRGCRELDTAE